MGQDFIVMIGIIVVLFGITYFMTIRPQQKRFKEHQNLLNELKNGDEVMTAGGFIGTVVSLDEDTAVIALEPDGINAKINRQSIVSNMTQNKTVD